MSHILTEWIFIIQKPGLNLGEFNMLTSVLPEASIELHTAFSFQIPIMYFFLWAAVRLEVKILMMLKNYIMFLGLCDFSTNRLVERLHKFFHKGLPDHLVVVLQIYCQGGCILKYFHVVFSS